MNRFTAIVAALAAAAALTGGAPAHAAPSGGGTDATCPSYSVCLYDGMNYAGAGVAIHRSTVGNAGCFNLGQVGFSNRADSGINNTGFNLRAYDSATCGGSYMWWPAGQWIPNFNVMYGNNRISAVVLS